jgi:hypothetical protein
VLAAVFHLLLGVETAAEAGRKVVLTMLAVGCIFIGVIALGELYDWLRHHR